MPSLVCPSIERHFVLERSEGSVRGQWASIEYPNHETAFSTANVVLTQHNSQSVQNGGQTLAHPDVPVIDVKTHASPVLDYLLHRFDSDACSLESRETAFKLLLPTSQGYLTEAEFLSRRLDGCDGVVSSKVFGVVGQEVGHRKSNRNMEDGKSRVLELFDATVGAIVMEPWTSDHLRQSSLALDDALIDRLSYPWIQHSRPRHLRIVLIEGRHLLRSKQGPPKLFSSASRLGISLVVVDRPGHEVQQAKQIREEFVAIDMTLDDGLPARIANAISQLTEPIDGLTSFTDRYLIATAKACRLLGLEPIMSPESLLVSTDKHQTRLLTTEESFPSILINSMEDFRARVADGPNELTFPLIVKPSRGANSEGVSKVTNHDDLCETVSRLSHTKLAWQSPIVVETYISGPEIDVNFVLLDGRVLFCEVVDDFPSPGDDEDSPSTSDFHESFMLYPSVLPRSERQLMKESVYDLLLRLGLRDGIFHVEARVRDSAKEYRNIYGVLDLEESQPSKQKSTQTPRLFLLEINARSPGQMPTCGTEFAYGIDYFGLQLLAAARDTERLGALSQPFLRGAQAWTNVVFLTASASGVFDSDDIFAGLRKHSPNLMAHVSLARNLFRRGDEIRPLADGSMPLVGWCVVWSRASRREAIQMGMKIRDAVSHKVVEATPDR